MKITVTAAHINEARQWQRGKHYEPSCHCPVALAIREATDVEWYVGCSAAASASHRFVMPKRVQTFIQAFDFEKQVKGFQFQFIPVEYGKPHPV